MLLKDSAGVLPKNSSLGPTENASKVWMKKGNNTIV